jgi:bacterioferritin-associated ferredoxin
MIICVCNAIGDKHLEGALARGATTVGDAFRSMGCAPVCGQCIPEMCAALSLRSNVCHDKA